MSNEWLEITLQGIKAIQSLMVAGTKNAATVDFGCVMNLMEFEILFSGRVE